ncbi:hypothetical protein SynBIOSU31_01711 [Synechococcus sp. BIOS-U3-1]|nr:hypothetical protein SynBIOSU31_01711 [Synechococcus sp. BIOS-U3-1]
MFETGAFLLRLAENESDKKKTAHNFFTACLFPCSAVA